MIWMHNITMKKCAMGQYMAICQCFNFGYFRVLTLYQHWHPLLPLPRQPLLRLCSLSWSMSTTADCMMRDALSVRSSPKWGLFSAFHPLPPFHDKPSVKMRLHNHILMKKCPLHRSQLQQWWGSSTRQAFNEWNWDQFSLLKWINKI